MGWIKTLLGVAAVAALVPYQVKVTPESEDGSAPKQISVKSLVYQIEVTPKKDEEEHGSAKITVPAEGIKIVVSKVKSVAKTVKEKSCVAKEKAADFREKAKEKAEEIKDKVTEGADTVKEKVTDMVEDVKTKVEEAKAKRTAKSAPDEEVPVEDIEVTPTEEPVPEDLSTPKTTKRRSSKKVEA